jgi:hypothetical protein
MGGGVEILSAMNACPELIKDATVALSDIQLP